MRLKIEPKDKYPYEYLVWNKKMLLGQIAWTKTFRSYDFFPIVSHYDEEMLHLSSDCLREIADFIDELPSKEGN